ncbi:MAG: NAD(P)/FAD-dependent oxidoreductase [Alphaproteobacteria bacterium]|nr:MAG: NAD(P)/FAD-dependent oxidoreductase [Alphaproteobacteria bacterium]
MTQTYEAAIVGAGFGGIGMGHALSRAGIHDFVILEAAEEVGGTWQANRYPGAGCDVPSHLYCFSFFPKVDWSRRYASQPEILQYLKDAVRELGLEPHIRLRSPVVRAVYEERDARWKLELEGGEVLTARHLVAATGQLRVPKLPSIPGRERFRGRAFHSARWPGDLDLENRRVGVIGTGASAIQIVPEVARKAASVIVFQRTPNWIVPRKDRPYRSLEKWLFAHMPGAIAAYRALLYWLFELRWPAFRSYRTLGPLFERQARRYLEEKMKHRPDLLAALTPDYPIGCKRVLLSDDFYDSLLLDHVVLETAGIAEITEAGVRMQDGRTHELDVLVYATGFEADAFVAPMEIIGRGGRSLQEVWNGAPFAHRGVTVPNFPNFYMLYGPNTNLGHNSIIFMLEREITYISRLIREARRRQAVRVEVREEAARRFAAEMHAALQRSVWLAGCHSWYVTEAGTSPTNWPYSTLSFAWRMRHLDLDNYRFA